MTENRKLKEAHTGTPTPCRHREDTVESEQSTSTAGRASTITQATTTAADQSKRSRKVDLEDFYNEPDRDKVPFEIWYNQVQDMRLDNADHFQRDSQVMTAIKAHVKGRAARELLPFLSRDHPYALTTSDALMRHLWNAYHDHTLADKAKEEYRNLKMDKVENFQTFFNDFVRLAGEKRLSRASWKEEFYDKLLNRVKLGVRQAYYNDSVDFQGLVEDCQQFVQTVIKMGPTQDKTPNKPSTADNTQKTGRTRQNNRDGGAPNRSQKPATAAAGKTYPRPTNQAELKKLYDAGLCFNCHQPGHRTTRCPLPQHGDAARRPADVSALFEKYGNKSTRADAAEVQSPALASNRSRIEELSSDAGSDDDVSGKE